MKLDLEYLAEKRRMLWYMYKNLQLDKEFCEACAEEILDTPELLKQVKEKPYLLIECCFTIVDKSKKSVPFFFNEVQRNFIYQLEEHGRGKPYFILKGRQQGFTTLITAIQLAYAITTENFSGFTLADREDNVRSIFMDKAKQMYNALPECLRPDEKINSVNELFFDGLNSSWRIAPASANIGRSRTLSFIHYSEVAFFKCSLAYIQKSIQEAAIKNAFCIYETTANGFNEAKALWDSGACVNLFYEWWKSAEYEEGDLSYLEKPTTWLKNRLKVLEEKGLDKHQLAWYARKYYSYMDKSSIKQEYPCTAEEAFVSSGECVFDKEVISNYMNKLKPPYSKGYFEYRRVYKEIKDDKGNLIALEKTLTDIEFYRCEEGYIRIEEKPFIEKTDTCIRKKPYVIGADTAGNGKDFFTAKVLDNTTGRCVATLRRQNMDEDLYAEQLFCLGKYYNDALIAVETNYSRHPVRVLRELSYPNVYTHKYATGAYDLEGYNGFLTTAVTRPMMIANLVAVMREDITLETDRVTLYEMLSFVKHPNGRYEAVEGGHDDLVMASAIAHFVRDSHPQKIEIIDTGSNVLEKSFNLALPEQKHFMEW